MTALRNPDTGQITSIVCDADMCGEIAPSEFEALRGGGLRGLGWYCAGGKHLCPAHAP